MWMRKMMRLLVDAAAGWSDDNAMRLSASLAYYTLFSMAPLLVVGMSIAGLFFGEAAARGQTAEQLRQLAGASTGDAILTFMQGASQRTASLSATFVGLLILLFGASGVFSELKDALNTIWGVTIKPGRALTRMVRERVLAFAMVLGVGCLLLVSLTLSAALAAVGKFAPHLPSWPPATLQFADNLVSFFVATFLFALLFKILPNVEIRWRDVGIGAAVTGSLFTLGKFLIGFYLGRAAVASYYGAAGSAIVLLMWVYYSACILFFGAEFTKVWVQQYGNGIVPDRRAVFRHLPEVTSNAGKPTVTE
jgi:membrane protein